MVRHVRLDIQLQPGGEKAFSFNILHCTIYRTYHTQHICTYSLYSDLQASTIRPFFNSWWTQRLIRMLLSAQNMISFSIILITLHLIQCNTLINLNMNSSQTHTLTDTVQMLNTLRHRKCTKVPSPATLDRMLRRISSQPQNIIDEYNLVLPQELNLKEKARSGDCPVNETVKRDAQVERLRAATSWSVSQTICIK